MEPKLKRVAHLLIHKLCEVLAGGPQTIVETSAKKQGVQSNRRIAKPFAKTRNYFVLFSTVDDRHDILSLK